MKTPDQTPAISSRPNITVQLAQHCRVDSRWSREHNLAYLHAVLPSSCILAYSPQRNALMMSTSSAMIGCNVSYQRLPASLPCPAPCRLHHRLSSCRRSHAPSRARSVRLVCNAVVARAPHDQAVPPAKRTVVSTTRCARCLPFATHLHIHIRYEGGVSIELSTVGSRLEVDIWAEPAKRRVLHWAVNAWELPPQSCWPPNTQQADNKACQTEFTNGNHVKIVFHEHDCPQRVVFVIKVRGQTPDGHQVMSCGCGNIIPKLIYESLVLNVSI